MAVLCSRNIEIKRIVNLLLTGKGNSRYAYATIKGQTKYPNDNSISVNVLSGDKVLLTVVGSSNLYVGKIVVDGETVLTSTDTNESTYEWTVPSNISSATLDFSYSTSKDGRYYSGVIGVTTV